MKYRRFAAFLVALVVGPIVGCGHSTPVKSFIPPASARTPDGARPESPPVRLTLGAQPSTHISVAGLRLIESFEGWSSCPYWDGYGHVWTRGYGETEGISSHSSCITRTQGELRLRTLVESRYEWALRSLGVKLNQNQWDALCSFVWNVGAGIFQGTKVGAALRAKDWKVTAASMLQYVHAGGVVLAGLVTRRRAEVALFEKPVSKPKPDLHVRLKRAYRYRAHLRRVLVEQHCRVPHPNLHCRGVLHSGAIVNQTIKQLHTQHIY